MRIPILYRALLTAAFSTFLLGQQPAVDTSKHRKDAEAAMRAKDYTAAAASWRKVTAAKPDDAEAWQLLGYSLHAAGKLDEALPAHLKAAEFPATKAVATYNVACVHALQGNPTEAFAWLEKAVAAGFDDLEQLRGDADFASIRKDPRMAKIEAAVQAKASGAQPQTMGFAQTVDRKSARAAWFAGRRDAMSSPGQIVIDYSPIGWKDEYEAAIAAGKNKGEKWRFGADFWTSLDTSLDVQLGSVNVPAGYYYQTLEQRDADQFVLALHDAATVKKQRLDASMANKLQGGIEIPMQHKSGTDAAPNLDIALALDSGKTAGNLVVRFGTHTLTAPFTVKLQ
jgi:tetratricopeptide (TPR) repeat protein